MMEFPKGPIIPPDNRPTKPLRSGLTEAAFRKYEVILQHACNGFPNSFKLNVPEGTSLLTLTARLRDSIKSYKDNNWPLTWDGSNIPRLTVHHGNAGVFIGGSKKLDLGGKPISVGATLTKPGSKTLHLRLEHLEAFCVLVSAKHLTGPIEFTLDAGVDPSNLEALFDVAIVPDGENKYILT